MREKYSKNYFEAKKYFKPKNVEKRHTKNYIKAKKFKLKQNLTKISLIIIKTLLQAQHKAPINLIMVKNLIMENLHLSKNVILQAFSTF